MAKLGVRIEATEEGTEQRTDFPNLPDGTYRLEVESATVDEKDKGTPQHKISVNTTIRVIEPSEYEGRKFFQNYNVQHPSAQAQEIGNRQFQCLLRALELNDLPDDDTDNLLFQSFTANVGMGKDSKEKNSDGSPKFKARNEIKRYFFPDQGNVPEPSVKAAPAAANDNRRTAASNDNKPAATAAGATRRPWGSK